MRGQADNLVGIGLYSVAEAAHLARIAPQTARRWILGYRYDQGSQRRNVPAALYADAPQVDGVVGLSFLDLMELRFVAAFRRYGVSLQTIRRAAQLAQEVFEQDHPFSRRRFSTDGRRIFAEILQEAGEVKFLDLVRSQYAFHRVVKPSLYSSVEFSDEDEAVCWHPMSPRQEVALDPRRAFGRPIVKHFGVPTAALAAAVEAEDGEGADAVRRVARWFDVSAPAVRAAVDFEGKLAERKLAA